MTADDTAPTPAPTPALSLDAAFATNRTLWNGWTRLHEGSAFYDVPAFRAGACTLKPPEVAALGDVAGRSLLHLQCHFGLDTLSWARRGARVVGVDLSDEAIALARRLSAETGIPGRFVEANVLDLPAALPPDVPREYDVVFTSYGVLAWLPDLARWARAVAACLAPGGAFHMVEFHPLVGALADDGRTLALPYFATGAPIVQPTHGSYAAPDAPVVLESVEWAHTLADVVQALLDAGLRLEALREYPYSSYGCFPFVVERAPDEWVVAGDGPAVPLMYSVRARRER